jgi:hypothetical protein
VVFWPWFPYWGLFVGPNFEFNDFDVCSHSQSYSKFSMIPRYGLRIKPIRHHSVFLQKIRHCGLITYQYNLNPHNMIHHDFEAHLAHRGGSKPTAQIHISEFVWLLPSLKRHYLENMYDMNSWCHYHLNHCVIFGICQPFFF